MARHALGLGVLEQPVRELLPGLQLGLQGILDANCSAQYGQRLENKHNASAVRPLLKSFGMRTMTYEVVECILENAPELAKTEIAAAAIVLGLAPSIIATLGIRPQDTAVLSIVGRRHVLAFAVAVGSPALNAYRASEYQSVIESLRDNTLRRPHVIRRYDTAIMVLEYALAAGSMANVGELTYRMGASMVFTVLLNSEYVALVWAFLGCVIHLMAGVTMRFRVSLRVVRDDDEVTGRSWPASIGKSEMDILTRRSKIRFRVHPESLVFSVLSLLTTVFTACHIIFGTLIFSSVVFISVNDSLSIVARMMAGTILARIIVTFELLVLRETIEESQDDFIPGQARQVLSFRREATCKIPDPPAE
ncbi:hypothetical protein QQX98_009847 [Neonectria punicea]|uniref:Gustatory receptor n=1 Tax=Neonectria punicea TaxID=979145 RepID=A0ABR1GRC5_9HYPO